MDGMKKTLLTLFLSFSPMLGVREAYSILWIPQNPNREGLSKTFLLLIGRFTNLSLEPLELSNPMPMSP